jgi:hypothetical protein
MSALTKNVTAVVERPVDKTAPVVRIRSLKTALSEARIKIHEDLLRFRTCCADPRASK